MCTFDPEGKTKHKLSKLLCCLAANLGDFSRSPRLFPGWQGDHRGKISLPCIKESKHTVTYSFMEHMSNLDLNFATPSYALDYHFYFSKILGDVMVGISEI